MIGNGEVNTYHPHCLLCGDRNPWSLKLRFSAAEDGGVRATFKGHRILEGYDGLLHGGVIASLLDSTMTNCLFQRGVNAVTGELNVRYRHSVPCDAELELRAQVVSEKRPLFLVESELLMASKIMAKATAKFMERLEEKH